MFVHINLVIRKVPERQLVNTVNSLCHYLTISEKTEGTDKEERKNVNYQ